jgi:ATP-binding cassette, subfamily B, multidrug efflux pump
MKKILGNLKPFFWSIVVVFILVFITTMTDLALPDFMSRIVDIGIVKGDSNYILSTGMEMIFIALIGALATVGVSFLAAKISAGVSKNIREEIFAKAESFSLIEFNKFGTSSLITRTTNDVQQVQMAVFMILRIALSAPIMAVGGIVKAVDKNPSMSWIIGVSVASLFVVIMSTIILAMPKFKMLQNLIDKLNLVSKERLNGLRVIRAFNTDIHEENKFDNVNKDLTKVNLFVNRVMVVLFPMMMLIMNVTAIAIVWYGAKKIDMGTLRIGDMMAFIQYSMQIIISFLMLSMLFIILPRSAVSIKRISEVLTTDLTIKDKKKTKKLPVKLMGKIEFKNVGFAYPLAEENVLSDISFIAEPGKTTAFIGSTGSGKSTLINLIPRFFDINSGSILIDNVDIRDLKQKQLRDIIGYVPQKGVLFSGTIASNIKYGKEDATKEEMKKASEVAQALEFIKSKEDKYDTTIAQGGTNVSGGQKQRLAIARALIKNPKIYIFDDSFSALDFKTDAALRGALKKYTKKATVLIVAQRIGTIMNADKIVVLDEGKIVGVGNHTSLMSNCKIYQEIALSQLSKEELA